MDLKLLRVNDASAIIVDDTDIGQQVLNDRLQSRVFNLKNCSVVKKWQSAACPEYFLDDINDALNGDMRLTQSSEGCNCRPRWLLMDDLVPIDHTIDNAIRLDEKVDVLGWEYIAKEVLVHSDEQLDIPKVINCAPNGAQLTANLG